jgi:preprotein translocase subunit SecE
MEAKKNTRSINWNPYDWLEQVKQEFFKISWTDSEELKVYTQLVVGATFIFGLGIYVVDVIIHAFLNGLASVIHLLGG